MGIFPSAETFSKEACKNRQNPDVYNVFKNILGRDKLWVSHDRFGVLRPTKDIVIPTELKENTINKPSWKTIDYWLHWDMNPWVWVESRKNPTKNKESYSNFNFPSENNNNYNYTEKVQALIALDDTPIENGGFICVLGFEKRLQKWAEDHAELAAQYDLRHFVRVPKDDLLFNEAVKIPVRAGYMIVWKDSQPHANYPNNCSKFRYCQYLKMFPVPESYDEEIAKKLD